MWCHMDDDSGIRNVECLKGENLGGQIDENKPQEAEIHEIDNKEERQWVTYVVEEKPSVFG